MESQSKEEKTKKTEEEEKEEQKRQQEEEDLIKQKKIELEDQGKLVTRASSDVLKPLQGKWVGYGIAISTKGDPPKYFKEVHEYFPGNDKNFKIEQGFGGFTFIRTCWELEVINKSLEFPYKAADFKEETLKNIIHQETGSFVCDHQLYTYIFGDNPVYVDPLGYRKNSSSSRGYGIVVQGKPNKDNTQFTFSTDFDPNTFGIILSADLEKEYKATHYSQKLKFSNDFNTLNYEEIVNFDKQDDQSILSYNNKAQLTRVNNDDNIGEMIIPFSYGTPSNLLTYDQSIELNHQSNNGALKYLQGTWEGYGYLQLEDTQYLYDRPPIAFFYEKQEFWPTYDTIDLTKQSISGFQYVRKIWRKKPKNTYHEYAQYVKNQDKTKEITINLKLPIKEDEFIALEDWDKKDLLSIVAHEETGSFIADHDLKESTQKITGYRKNLSVARGQAIIARAEAGENENELVFKTNSTDQPIGVLTSTNLDKDFQSTSYDLTMTFSKSDDENHKDQLKLHYIENINLKRDINKDGQFAFNHRSQAFLYKVSNENYMTKTYSE